jgi:hypothetical protein
MTFARSKILFPLLSKRSRLREMLAKFPACKRASSSKRPSNLLFWPPFDQWDVQSS